MGKSRNSVALDTESLNRNWTKSETVITKMFTGTNVKKNRKKHPGKGNRALILEKHKSLEQAM